jgi:hypothetical protein
LENPLSFNAGDWVIIKKELRRKSHYPLKIVSISNQHVLIDLWGNGESSINPFYYELATEEEIKIHKIKNMF